MNRKTALGLILIAVLTVSAYTQQYDSESDFRVNREGNGVEITKYLGSKTEIRIPPRIQNLSVTSIGLAAFEDHEGITSVIIPNSVTSIRNATFKNCTSLTSVTFQGTIPSSGFHLSAFDSPPAGYVVNVNNNDLRAKYLAGDIGTYTRASGDTTWTKK